jgi:hypothetical protein
MTYSNYITENLDEQLVYKEYIMELDSSITYANYLAEQLESTINYTQYLDMYKLDIDEVKRKRLDRKISRQKRKRNGKLKNIIRNI